MKLGITQRIALLLTEVVKHRHDDQRSYRHPAQYSPLITPELGRSIIGWVEVALGFCRVENWCLNKCESIGIHPQHPKSLESHTPSPRPLKDRLEFLTEQASNEGRTSSRDRRSALARIAEPDLRGNPLLRAGVNFDSGRLQDVEILYDGVINQEQIFYPQLLFESTCLSCLGGVPIRTVALSSVSSPYGLKLSFKYD